MALSDEIRASLDDIAVAPWGVIHARDVPETSEVALRNGAAAIDATYLYADVVDSSRLAQSVDAETAARVIRMYLSMAVRVLRHQGGHIRSFDGDRVMAVFMGDSKNSSAFRSALAINYWVSQVLREEIDSRFAAVRTAGWSLKHGVGIDTGSALLVRGGVRNNNDLIAVGSAPNVAAKLSAVRDIDPVHVTYRSIIRVKEAFRLHADGRTRHRLCGDKTIGGETLTVHSSNWYWAL